MAEETGIQEAENNAAENQEKTFTQDEVNALIGERLGRAKGKHEEEVSALNAKIADLEKKLSGEPGSEPEEEQNEELAKALARVAELEAAEAERETKAKRAELVTEALKAHNVAAEYAPLLDYVPDDELDTMATLLGKRFAEPSKNERRRADVSGTEDEKKEWANSFLSGQN